MSSYILNNDLAINETTGLINTIDQSTLDAVKEKAYLFMSTNSNSIPFSTFGTTLIERLFTISDEDIFNENMTILISNLNRIISRSNYKVKDYKMNMDKTKREYNLTILLNTGDILELSNRG